MSHRPLLAVVVILLLVACGSSPPTQQEKPCIPVFEIDKGDWRATTLQDFDIRRCENNRLKCFSAKCQMEFWHEASNLDLGFAVASTGPVTASAAVYLTGQTGATGVSVCRQSAKFGRLVIVTWGKDVSVYNYQFTTENERCR